MFLSSLCYLQFLIPPAYAWCFTAYRLWLHCYTMLTEWLMLLPWSSCAALFPLICMTPHHSLSSYDSAAANCTMSDWCCSSPVFMQPYPWMSAIHDAFLQPLVFYSARCWINAYRVTGMLSIGLHVDVVPIYFPALMNTYRLHSPRLLLRRRWTRCRVSDWAAIICRFVFMF